MTEHAVSADHDPEVLCDDEGPIPTFPPLLIDAATGRTAPLSDDESKARRAATIRAIDAIARITDETDTEELWVQGMRDIDAHRPHRKLFEGMS